MGTAIQSAIEAFPLPKGGMTLASGRAKKEKA